MEGYEENQQGEAEARKGLHSILFEFYLAGELCWIELNLFCYSILSSIPLPPLRVFSHPREQHPTQNGSVGRASIYIFSSNAHPMHSSETRAPDSDAMSSIWVAEMQREFNAFFDIVKPLLGELADKQIDNSFLFYI